MNTIYLIIAYRTKGEHSYAVGIYDNFDFACDAAKEECYDRGGKYSVYVYEVLKNKQLEYCKDEAQFVIKGRE